MTVSMSEDDEVWGGREKEDYSDEDGLTRGDKLRWFSNCYVYSMTCETLSL